MLTWKRGTLKEMIAKGQIDILLVEDNEDDIELALRAFRKSEIGDRIHVARDGVEALNYLFGAGEFAGRPIEDVPRLILLDLKLPRVDGMGVLRRIKTDPRTRSIPTVVMTSSGEQSDMVESYDLGVNSYIVKPVDFERFQEVARELGCYWLTLNKRPDQNS